MIVKTINLLPWREWERKNALKQLCQYLLFGIFCGLIVAVFVHMIFIFYLFKVENQVSENQQQLHVTNQSLEEIHNVQLQKKHLLSDLMFIHALQMQRVKLIEMLNQIPLIIPENVLLDAITFKQNQWQFSGRAETSAATASVLQNLSRIPSLQNTELIQNKTLNSAEIYKNQFVIVAQVKPLAGVIPAKAGIQ